jgi:hypothetical protein
VIGMVGRKRVSLDALLSVLLGAAVLAGGCAVLEFIAGTGEEAAGEKPPAVVSRFNHLIHVEGAELGCTDCHEGAQESARAGLPAFEFCEGCHEDDENEDYVKWLQVEPKESGTTVIKRYTKRGFDDVVAPHDIHFAMEVSCDTCHGNVGKSEEILENTVLSKEFCMGCHEGSLGCSDCHEVIRKTTEPASHRNRWLESHGPVALPKLGSPNKRCFLCHEESACGDCHKTKKPSSHSGSWKRFHGSEVDMEFELQENACFFCHKQLDCDTCHSTESPSSHTASWRNRTHGLHAETERDTCLVCHNQDYCARCHKAAPPQPRDAAHIADADCGSCHAFLEHGFRATENFECAKCHR